MGGPQVQDQTGVRFSGCCRDPHPPLVSLPDLLQLGENFSRFSQRPQACWSEVTWACHDVLLSMEDVITPQGPLVPTGVAKKSSQKPVAMTTWNTCLPPRQGHYRTGDSRTPQH